MILVTSVVIGALIGGGISIGVQLGSSGTVDWGRVGIAMGFGAAVGLAIGFSAIGLVPVSALLKGALISAGISGSINLLQKGLTGESVDWTLLEDVAIGAAAGMVGGAVASVIKTGFLAIYTSYSKTGLALISAYAGMVEGYAGTTLKQGALSAYTDRAPSAEDYAIALGISMGAGAVAGGLSGYKYPGSVTSKTHHKLYQNLDDGTYSIHSSIRKFVRPNGFQKYINLRRSLRNFGVVRFGEVKYSSSVVRYSAGIKSKFNIYSYGIVAAIKGDVDLSDFYLGSE